VLGCPSSALCQGASDSSHNPSLLKAASWSLAESEEVSSVRQRTSRVLPVRLSYLYLLITFIENFMLRQIVG
jgi:hypothetical protein